MTKHENSYQAVMEGMDGYSLTDTRRLTSDFAGQNALDCLAAIRSLDELEIGDLAYFACGTFTGLMQHEFLRDAYEYAESTHKHNNRAAYSILRTTEGFTVRKVF